MLRIMIADDHPIVRQGLEKVLRKEYPSAIIEQVASGDDLIKNVIKFDWDLIISDMTMPGTNGLEALQQIKGFRPQLPILILSMHPEEQYALRALKAGASGYLNKDMMAEELIAATRRVLMGRKYITPSIAERLAEVMNDDHSRLPHEQLSDREFEVLKLLANGKSLTEIGQLLAVTATTVSTYRARILSKMGFKTNADLTRYGISNNII
ncbi:response regulator [Flavitalea flava]